MMGWSWCSWWGEEILVEKVHGELFPTAKETGRYPIRVAIESHDRSQVLAEAWGGVVASQRFVSCPEGGEDERSPSGEKVDPIVLHHSLSLRPSHARYACEMMCLLTADFDQAWIAATRRLTAHVAARGQGVPFFVQIGSNEGTGSHKPLYKRIVEDNWQGMLMEPLSNIFARLQANHGGQAGLAFANVAVTDASHAGDGCVMQRVAPAAILEGEAADWWFDSLASFSPDRSVIAGVLPPTPNPPTPNPPTPNPNA